MPDKSIYDESNIRLLKPNEHIRLRAGMYVGGTDKSALHQVIHEAINDGVNEALNGYCNHIWITLRPDNEVCIQHNGRGLRPNNDYGIQLLEAIMTYMGSLSGDLEYMAVGGLHGSQISVVNALSAECEIEITYERSLLRQSYRAGIPQTEVIEVRQLDEGEHMGMTITFRPDFTILEPNDIDYEFLLERSRELAYLLAELTITLSDERSDKPRQDEFHFPNGLADYIAYLNRDKTVLHDPVTGSSEWTIRPRDTVEYTVAVDIAFQYTDTTETAITGYVNTVRTTGGFHTELFPLALLNDINRLNDQMNLDKISLDVMMPGLVAIVAVKHPHPSFPRTNKLKLLNHDVGGNIIDAIFNAGYINQHTLIMKKLITNKEAIKK